MKPRSALAVSEPFLLGLLNRPWTEIDCCEVVRRVFAHVGRPLPDGALAGVDPSLWERVGDGWTAATRVLDVITSDPLRRGCESHLSVVVRAEKPQVALSSSVVGGVRSVRPWAIQRVLGVYRLREAL